MVDRQYANTICPYCRVTLDPLPMAKSACPGCGSPIHVRFGPDGLWYLLQEADIPVLEQEWGESQRPRGWRRAALRLVDGLGLEGIDSGGRNLVLLFVLVSLAVGIMVPAGIAILTGTPFVGTADVALVEPSAPAGSLASGAATVPTQAPTQGPAPARTTAPTHAPTPTPAPSPHPAPKPTPDTQRPSILRRTPERNAVSVPAASAIQVAFSEPVKGVSRATFQLVNVPGGWVVRSTVRYDAASRTATLTPTRRMYPSTEYRVEILPGITDRSGNRLKATGWTFRVASG